MVSEWQFFFKPLCFICLKNVSYGYIKCTCFSHTFKRCLSDKVQFIMFYNKQSNAKTSNVYKIVGTKCIQVSGRKHSNITTMHPTFDKKRNRQQISSWRGGEDNFWVILFFNLIWKARVLSLHPIPLLCHLDRGTCTSPLYISILKVLIYLP